jgi:hypothetical protein
MTTKRHDCPTCGGISIWYATLDLGNPVWECRNCHRQIPRRVLKRKPNPLLERALRNLGYDLDDLR